MLIMLDMKGICASSGSACTSGSLDPSHVLLAIGLKHEEAHGSLRLTLSEESTKEEMDIVAEEVKKIVGILLKDLTLRCKDQMGIELKVRDSVKELIAKEGFDPKYGARPLRRAIQNKIEDAMAEEILEGRIKQGDKVIIGVSKEKIKFMVKHD